MRRSLKGDQELAVCSLHDIHYPLDVKAMTSFKEQGISQGKWLRLSAGTKHLPKCCNITFSSFVGEKS